MTIAVCVGQAQVIIEFLRQTCHRVSLALGIGVERDLAGVFTVDDFDLRTHAAIHPEALTNDVDDVMAR